MMQTEQLYSACADMLQELRTETGTTKEKMADALNVNKKTYLRYEEGSSAPAVPDFIHLFAVLGKDALHTVLNKLYPDQFGLTQNSSTEALKTSLIYYINNIASDREVRELSFVIHGGHGSNWYPQLEEFCALDHLPLESRLMVAELISNLYDLSENLNRLIATDHIMPDMKIFREGIEQGRKAVYQGRSSYTTSSEI